MHQKAADKLFVAEGDFPFDNRCLGEKDISL